jgi:hypothetical protein
MDEERMAGTEIDCCSSNLSTASNDPFEVLADSCRVTDESDDLDTEPLGCIELDSFTNVCEEADFGALLAGTVRASQAAERLSAAKEDLDASMGMTGYGLENEVANWFNLAKIKRCVKRAH